MSTEVVEQATNSNLSMNTTFEWYKESLCKILDEASKEFWEDSFEYKLISIAKNPCLFSKNSDYFVTQVKLNPEISTSIKLCQNTVDIFLENSLGKNGDYFEIDFLTELEAKILTTFNHHLYKKLTELFKAEAKIKKMIKEKELKNNYLYFGFLVHYKNKPFGKTIIQLPEQILKVPQVISPPKESLSEFLFENCPIDINIFVGKTRTTLEDIKLIESGDIILLENSDISKMRVKGKFDFEFNLNPDPMLVYNYQDNEEYESSEDNMTEIKNEKNRWDLIQVDMSAEFEKIKMPLGELRQISKGLIIDLASVYQNKITLKVEDNPIATGELVIIDDKYGVLLDEVLTDAEKNKQQELSEEASKTVQENPTKEDEGEDFDLEDFDIDDDDLDDDIEDDDFDDEDI